MSVLVLLWVGTLGVIYASSYFEMSKQNKAMLKTHAQMYSLSHQIEEKAPPEKPFPNFEQTPSFRLSTFYTVAIDYSGRVIEIKNDKPNVYSDTYLENMAKSIVKSGNANGTKKNLAYYKTDKDGYTLVAFKDNTVINEGALTLFRYTLIFGVFALAVFFFLSVFLAKKIVDPLEQSFEKQKQFISDAGHELKTPVSVVGANAELLSRQIGNNQWLSNIRYENERMGLLVGQLLQLAKTENVTPLMERIDFSRLVAGESLPFESVAFEKGLTLVTDIANDIGVMGDNNQLGQLVSILLDNAVRHSKGGDIRLVLKKEHGFAKLSVVNSGDEIPKKHLNRIFERFYRVDGARNGEDKHYGLGLAIAKSIVALHKGSIDVSCHDGLIIFKVQIAAI